MKGTEIYSSKAEKFARYRWDYASQAVEAILQIAQLSDHSVVADIGAGTGILTKHFVGRVGQLYAVEPNEAMRRMAEQALPRDERCSVLKGQAEAIPLGDQSVDLITVAQSLHWFEPEPTRKEFLRIHKPGGWLALLCNYGVDQPLQSAIQGLCVAKNGVGKVDLPEQKPLSYFFGQDDFQRLTFGFTEHQDWERFFGSMLSASFMPDEGHPLFTKLERAARDVFEAFSENGMLRMQAETEVVIGQILG